MRLLIVALALALTPSWAFAQDYPTSPVTIVVPFSAGGPTDTVTRLVAEAMSRDLGQQIVVENVGGAGGTLGAGRVADAEPDGRSEEHTSELQSLMRISYAVFCLKKKKIKNRNTNRNQSKPSIHKTTHNYYQHTTY